MVGVQIKLYFLSIVVTFNGSPKEIIFDIGIETHTIPHAVGRRGNLI